jgi:hypothetical protein
MVLNGLFPVPLQDLIATNNLLWLCQDFPLSSCLMWQSIGMLLLQVKLGLLIDLHLLLRLVIVLPLMEAIGSLLKFAQRQDVPICDFIAIVKVYQGQLYKLYSNNITFINDELWSLNGLMVCDHQQIHTKWVTNYNSNVVEHFFWCWMVKKYGFIWMLSIQR